MPKIMFTSNVHVGLWRTVWIVTFPPLSTSGMVMVQQPADSEIIMEVPAKTFILKQQSRCKVETQLCIDDLKKDGDPMMLFLFEKVWHRSRHQHSRMFHISSQRDLFLGVAEGDFCQLWKRNGLSVSESRSTESLLLSYIKMLCSSPFISKEWNNFLAVCHAIRYKGSSWIWGWAFRCYGKILRKTGLYYHSATVYLGKFFFLFESQLS